MGFFDYIGDFFVEVFDLGVKIVNFLKKSFIKHQENIQHRPQPTNYTVNYNTTTANPNQELRWANDPTTINVPNNPTIATCGMNYMPGYQTVYQYTNFANPNYYQIPTMYQVDPYAYGYEERVPVNTNWNNGTVMNMGYPTYNNTMNTQQYNYGYTIPPQQELRWKETPDMKPYTYGQDASIHFTSYNPTCSVQMTSEPVNYTSPTPTYHENHEQQPDWSTIKWSSDVLDQKNGAIFVKQTKITETTEPLKPTTDDGVVCAFGRRTVG